MSPINRVDVIYAIHRHTHARVQKEGRSYEGMSVRATGKRALVRAETAENTMKGKGGRASSHISRWAPQSKQRGEEGGTDVQEHVGHAVAALPVLVKNSHGDVQSMVDDGALVSVCVFTGVLV